MVKYLLIVESPSKCLTIKKYLGNDYKIVASVGHVRQIPKQASSVDKKTFDVIYEISEDKKDVVKGLKEAVKSADFVYYASDYDREGESISWHLQEILQLPKSKYKRITFTEITKKALEEALKNPRDIDMNLVDSQRCRSVLDRLVGYDVSSILNQKVQVGTSGGRVQSVGLRLVTERWQEYNKFTSDSDFKTIGIFEIKDEKNKIYQLKAVLNKKFSSKEESISFLQKCIDKNFVIENIEKKDGRKKALPPFTTTTMQIDAIRKLGMTAERVTSAAQSLYQHGHVSYIRTDSVSMSDDSLNASEKQIKEEYGNKYSQKKQHQTKNKNAQESHECIRPSYFEKHEVDGTSDEKRLYELIWKRAISSQMADCLLENTIITIGCKELKEKFIVRGTVIVFDGFMRVYSESTDDKDDEDDSGILPPVKIGQDANYISITSGQIFSKPKPLFNEASLIKELENIGVGRPSTYNHILKVLNTRGYVDKKDLPAKKRDVCNITLINKKIDESIRTENFGAEKSKMIPTDLGMVVCEYLKNNFEILLDYDFTKKMELTLDSVAEGKSEWKKVLHEFYTPFTDIVNKAKGTEKAGGRELGLNPTSKKLIIARIAKFGAVVQEGTEKGDIKFAKIPEGQSIDTITLKEALELLKWPKLLGQHKKKDVTVSIGKFGPYVKFDDKFCSISLDPDTITLEEAIEVIKIKEAGGGNSAKTLHKFGDIVVIDGKFGPYINHKKTNYKIPVGTDIDSLTKELCLEIVNGTSSAPKTKFKKFAKKKK